MDKIKVKEDIITWGWQVKTFPNGIGESFEKLMALIPDAIDRAFYGISYMEGNKMIYNATVVENFPGEAEQYNCQRYTIDKGEYAAITVKDWKLKTHTINDVFSEMATKVPDLHQPAIEWYKDDKEMVCMVLLSRPKETALTS